MATATACAAASTNERQRQRAAPPSPCSGYPDEYFDTYTAKVRNVRIADVQDVAKSVMHPDNLIWIIVGDRAKIEAGIRELNLGELHLIDADGNPIR